jgi:hypothetical protein
MGTDRDYLARAVLALGREFYGEPIGPILAILPKVAESLEVLTIDPDSVAGGRYLMAEMMPVIPALTQRRS